MTTVITYTHSSDEVYFNQYTGTLAQIDLKHCAEAAASYGWSDIEFIARRNGVYHMNRLRGPDWENTPIDRSRWSLTVMGDKTHFRSHSDIDPTDAYWNYIWWLAGTLGYTSDQLIAIKDIQTNAIQAGYLARFLNAS